jgi:hypothetical protein
MRPSSFINLIGASMANVRFSRLLFTAAIACTAAFSSFVSDTVHIVFASIQSAVLRVCDWARSKVKGVLAKFSPTVLARPVVAIVSAKAAVARLVRRKTLRLEAGWRFCPSI